MKIVFFFVICALINSVAFSTLSINKETDLDTKSFCFQTLISLIFAINSSSVAVIIFYLSGLTCKRIDKLIFQVKQNQFHDLGSLYNKILDIKKNIVTMNKAISFGLFIKLIDSGLNMSSMGCLLALTLQQNHLKSLQNLSRIIGTTSILTYELIKCTIIFYSSSNLYKKCEELNEQVEMQINGSNVSTKLFNQAIVIFKINQGIYFNAVFFEIKKSTFLTLLGQVISILFF